MKCEHEKINSISPRVHVLFCLLYKHTNNDVFDEFPKISEEVPMMFRSLNTTSEYFLSDYIAIAMATLRLVTTTYMENIWIFSVAEIS